MSSVRPGMSASLRYVERRRALEHVGRGARAHVLVQRGRCRPGTGRRRRSARRAGTRAPSRRRPAARARRRSARRPSPVCTSTCDGPARVAGRVDLVPEPAAGDQQRDERPRRARSATIDAAGAGRRRRAAAGPAGAVGVVGARRRPCRWSRLRLQVRLEHHRGGHLVDDLLARVAAHPGLDQAPLARSPW